MNILISPQNPVPLYQQIVEQLRGQIVKGELPAGTMLPSIRELARELTTSVITTKRAYQELERDGLIVTRPGIGTFVATVPPEVLKGMQRDIARAFLREVIDRILAMGLSKDDVSALMCEILKGKEQEEW